MTFHYDETGKLVGRAVAHLASSAKTRISSITGGGTAHLWHYKVADDIVDSIVVHGIWDIPKEADTRAEADKVAGELYKISCWFLDFAGEFIRRHCEGMWR